MLGKLTNADTPYLAVRDLIPGATNPFTGSVFDMSGKQDGFNVLYSTNHNFGSFTPEGRWYHISENIYDKDN